MLNPEIRDQAYQFFIEEAPELLHMIESGLLTLKEERSKQTVHEIMRAAHSIKGGAASVELDHIKTLAHRLEDIFKALYDDSVVIDTELETLLLQGYDCLRQPLEEQMAKGSYDGEGAIAYAEPIWQKIEAHLGDSLNNADQYIPSSADLGVDIVNSLFEVDVTQGLEHLATVAAHPNDYDVIMELQSQMEVFSGFAEMLGLPGFGEITQATLRALELNPDKASYILQLALVDLIEGRAQVLEKNDRTSGGTPSAALLAFSAGGRETEENGSSLGWDDANVLSFDNLFEEAVIDEIVEESGWTEIDTLTSRKISPSIQEFSTEEANIFADKQDFTELNELFGEPLQSEEVSPLADIFVQENGQILEGEDRFDVELDHDQAGIKAEENLDLFDKNPELEDVFGTELRDDSFLVEENVNPELEDIFGVELTDDSLFSEDNETVSIINESPELEDVFNLSLETETPEESQRVELEINGTVEVNQTSHDLGDIFGVNETEIDENIFNFEEMDQVLDNETDDTHPSLDVVFGLNAAIIEDQALPLESAENIEQKEAIIDETVEEIIPDESDSLKTSRFTHSEIPTLEDIFGQIENSENLFILEEETKEKDEIIEDKTDSETETISEYPSSPLPSLDEVFGSLDQETISETKPEQVSNGKVKSEKETVVNHKIEKAIEDVESIFDNLPPVEDQLTFTSPENSRQKTPTRQPITKAQSSVSSNKKTRSDSQTTKTKTPSSPSTPTNLSIKVDFNRLERMNNLVGELMINRNSLSLQNEQMQGSVKALLNRFMNFQGMIGKLQELSDKMLIAPERMDSQRVQSSQIQDMSRGLTNFDSLEMDSYSSLYSLLGILLEEMIQLEESVDDVVLFARTSNQTLEQQRQMLTNLRDELMWARMLPLGEVLNRFPRLLRDLSATYGKPVRLKLTGTGVLVDKAALEKLYDPLLHLLRNGFDHGIEPPEERKKAGKPPEGQIEIRAYHQGNQTIVEISDDGRGLDYEKIKEKAIQYQIVTAEQMAVASKERIQDLIFEPGFSTAVQVSELSGRGVGLDVVRSQLRSLKGTVSVTSKEGRGTLFTLQLPLTLTIAKLLVCQVSYENTNSRVSVAFPSDTIDEILVPEEKQIKTSGNQRFLLWNGQIVPIYPVKDLLKYNCPLPETFANKGLKLQTLDEWGLPLLLLRRGQQLYGLEVSRLETEQELVIKPFGNAISAPIYTYGCTILGDGKLIPVVNGATLIEQAIDPNYSATVSIADTQTVESLSVPSIAEFEPKVATMQAPLMLVVDDSAALRRTLALTLEKAGYRVVQARDGREALDQLQQTAGINMVLCDVEMPNMNGFEFLGQRRRDPQMMTIPVAMLTSRSSEKHRQLAMTLGASAYFTKPFIEQQFLTSIANILQEKGMKQLTVNSKQ